MKKLNSFYMENEHIYEILREISLKLLIVKFSKDY
jgi:hypothetical protein